MRSAFVYILVIIVNNAPPFSLLSLLSFLFLVSVATDGLWDVLSSQECVAMIQKVPCRPCCRLINHC